jgi:DeoR family transcriptional regulator, glycerol-3-phosphate regulon repressor
MFTEERLNIILDLLQKNGKVSVNELSEKFSLTKDAIRKDLQKLEKIGKLKRTYGGAIQQREIARNIKVLNRVNKNLRAKKIITEKAVTLINDGDTIFLDISSTNLILASLLAETKKKITIITNMLDIMNKLSNSPQVKLIGIGGTYRIELNGYIGAATIEQINEYRIDKAFIGSAGINMKEKNLSTFDVEDGLTKKAIINVSKEVVLLAERNKFDLDGNYIFSDFERLDTIITNQKITSEFTRQFKNYNIKIHTV